jgi:hypothetical protein
LIVLSAFSLCAHGTSYGSEPGKLDFSVFSTYLGGISYNTGFVVDSKSTIIGYTFDEVTVRQNAGGPGLISMAEYTVAPGLALGLIVNVPQFLIAGLQDGGYNFCAAATVDWKWLRSDRWTLGARLELEAAPLFGEQNIFGEGFYDIFATPLSASYELLRHGDFALVAYGDAKAVTSLLNPAYRDYEGDFTKHVSFSGPHILDGLPHTFGPGYRFFFAPGLEARYKNFYLSVGYNVFLAQYSVIWRNVGHFPEEEGFEKIEFSWRWRF